jgi:predicted nucleic acid-binding protein
MATDAILDSSVIVALVVQEEYSEWALKKMENYYFFHGLDLSFYEVANAIEHKKFSRLDKNNAISAFNQARKIMNLYSFHGFSEVIDEALNKALELNIAVYDAAFLSLAEKLKMPFLTLDIKLAKKLEHTKYKDIVEYPNK